VRCATNNFGQFETAKSLRSVRQLEAVTNPSATMGGEKLQILSRATFTRDHVQFGCDKPPMLRPFAFVLFSTGTSVS